MIGSGDGLLLVDNKPLPEPVVTQIFYHHMVSPGHSVLTQDCDNYGVLANSNGVILAISLLYEID